MPPRRLLASAVASLPQGRTLPASEFRRRHVALLIILWLHVPALGLFAVAMGNGILHSLFEAGLIATFAVAAGRLRDTPRLQATAVALGLMTASAVLVHLWEGRIEAHFHFFLVIYVLVLYEDWLPFGLSVGFVVLHHGLLSTLQATSVFDHPGAIEHPWRWALVHGGFILAASAAAITTWRMNESIRSRMDHQALHDALTGLPNRRLFIDRLESTTLRSRRGSGRHAILFVDLDGFKRVNDSLGHAAGDELLIHTAARLDAAVRGEDTVARFGGDEFVVLADHAGEAATLALAARIAATVAEPVEVGGHPVAVTASIGIALTGAAFSTEALLRDADAAMYRAKQRGRGQVELFDEALRERVERRRELERDLPLAIKRSELRLHYQPAVRIPAGEIVGFEALLRWEHPLFGLVPPDDFIPLAEASGLIHPIGGWVLREACCELSRLNERRGERAPLRMAVNISRRQLERPELVDTVAEALAGTGVPPELLCLEITETAAIADLDASTRALLGLRRLGVRLAIDDFGVGFSSLSELKRLPPVDVLKIDKSFVDGIASPDDRAIVAAILSLAEVLGVTALAEGVELASQADELEALGCGLGQGYLWSRPVPAHELDALLERFAVEVEVAAAAP